MDENLVLACFNRHVDGCGEPPRLTTKTKNKYFGYFENLNGEQWIYIYDYSNDKAIILGGDAGWENSIEVIDGKAPTLVLNEQEQKWLEVCWMVSKRK